MPRVLNLTPHPITLPTVDPDRQRVTIAPSGQIARIDLPPQPGGQLHLDLDDGTSAIVTATVTSTPAGLTGLPDPTPETIYVVSRMVAEAYPRADLYIPGQQTRDETGRINGCLSLEQTAACHQLHLQAQGPARPLPPSPVAE